MLPCIYRHHALLRNEFLYRLMTDYYALDLVNRKDFSIRTGRNASILALVVLSVRAVVWNCKERHRPLAREIPCLISVGKESAILGRTVVVTSELARQARTLEAQL